MQAPNFKQLQRDIKGQEFELAKRIFGLSGEQEQNAKIQGLRCPKCKENDLYFRQEDAKFCCGQCNFAGELIQLVSDALEVSHNKAYGIIVESAGQCVDDEPNEAEHTTVEIAVPSNDAMPERIEMPSTIPIAESTHSLDLENHPLANMFPMLSDDEQRELTADIKKNGQLEPIWLYEGNVLDGRNRYKSCKELGNTPIIKEYTGNDPLAFVLSKNLHRRHLTTGQRSMVAAKIEQFQHGGSRKNQDANLHLDRKQVAKSLNVSPRSVANASKVRTKAVPEVAEAVEAGKLPVSVAAKLSDAPPEEQREEIARIDQGEDCISIKSQSSPNDQIVRDLKMALQLPVNSAERSDALFDVLQPVIYKSFPDSKVRRAFLKKMLTGCTELGVKPT